MHIERWVDWILRRHDELATEYMTWHKIQLILIKDFLEAVMQDGWDDKQGLLTHIIEEIKTDLEKSKEGEPCQEKKEK